ncbi:Mob1/phocein [Pilatotrama ljubarskyi]|nr:Mob1/phocein [Pilatotrama ljubarskyi]
MTAAIQRPLKGSRISSFYPVKSLPPISALDSAFQLQEYISLLIRLDVHDVERIIAIPGKDQSENSENGESKGDEKDADKDAAGGVHVDPACWVYEHLRRVAQDLSHPLITMLQQECTRGTCPEMKAGEWLYLCVAHGNEGAMEQCCAIDYILHTLDSATALLNSPRAFPSRLSVPSTSHRHFTSLCRRLGRIFAHAYFHHREVFEQAEAESSLYARFLALVKYFDLVPLEFLVIPPRMEGRMEPVEPPRLMGAALDPRKDSGRQDGGASWLGAQDGALRTDRGKSPPGPAGQTRNESPRKFGRARTDTMVYSEAYSVAEELAKGDLSEVDIDREIAAERAAAAAGTTETLLPTERAVVMPPPNMPSIVLPPRELESTSTSQSQHQPPEANQGSQPMEESPATEPTPEVVTEEDHPPVAAVEELRSHESAETPQDTPAPSAEEPSAPTAEANAAAAEPSTEEAPLLETEETDTSESSEPRPDEPTSSPPPPAEEAASGEDQSTESEAEAAASEAPSEPAPETSGEETPGEASEEPAEAAHVEEPSGSVEKPSYAAVASTGGDESAPTSADEEAEGSEAPPAEAEASPKEEEAPMPES